VRILADHANTVSLFAAVNPALLLNGRLLPLCFAVQIWRDYIRFRQECAACEVRFQAGGLGPFCAFRSNLVVSLNRLGSMIYLTALWPTVLMQQRIRNRSESRVSRRVPSKIIRLRLAGLLTIGIPRKARTAAIPAPSRLYFYTFASVFAS
jgi:hypothetical protein